MSCSPFIISSNRIGVVGQIELSIKVHLPLAVNCLTQVYGSSTNDGSNKNNSITRRFGFGNFESSKNNNGKTQITRLRLQQYLLNWQNDKNMVATTR